MASYTEETLLDVFSGIARNSATCNLNAVECNGESWTYKDLDVISTGIAVTLKSQYGLRPVVAVVSENHPYILAILFATWKLGGIVAPLDHHAPSNLMERMLLNIAPTCVVSPSTDNSVLELVKKLGFPSFSFSPEDSTITALSRNFLQLPSLVASESFPSPSAEDIALYLHTSSASSVSNLKCVPLTHLNIITGCRGRLSWWKQTWPQRSFENLRVLGWSPWSHVIGVSHDIGAATLLSAGCYIFALTPSTYFVERAAEHKSTGDLSIPSQLLQAIIEKKPTAFAAVPWLMEGIMAKWKAETDPVQKASFSDALSFLSVIGAGGAKTCPEFIQWAKDLRLPFVIDIGMTEVGGPIFHEAPGEEIGCMISDCFIPDGELTLLGDNGDKATSEGELVITSRIISKGYLNYDSPAYTIDSNGKVTFRTGDIYERTHEDCLVWKGRREEFIQMTSGESLDPRVIETALNRCPVIAHSCIAGNNFLAGPAQFVCAIIELTSEALNAGQSSIGEVTKAVGMVNRTLAPPLRIAWSRVLILSEGQHLPFTKKRAILRKKLEEMFGDQLTALLKRANDDTNLGTVSNVAFNADANIHKDEVEIIVSRAVSDALKIPIDMLEMNSELTFAELGMDSAMATVIVNTLNRSFGLGLPMNTCHTHIDLITLTEAICAELGLGGADSKAHDSHPSGREPALQCPSDVEEVVIVGQSLRLPGDLNSPDSFWQALIERRNDIMSEVPEHRWDHASFYRPPNSTSPPQPCDITFKKAGFIDLAHFDNSFFGISSAEALCVAPAIRLTLESAFEALENANIPISHVKGTKMGIYVAAGVDEGYNKLLFLDKGYSAYSRFYGTGTAISTACGRLSYLLDVHGPSITVDTACSSGLVAFDEATRYLQTGQGESAIVCGVNTHTWPGTFGFLSAQKMTSINSRCATFTNEADGYVASEGAAAVILKTKSAAMRDGDTILAVVKSTDIQHDGRSQGLVAPNVKAQISMQRALLQKSSLHPSQIDFIETHGTGTTLGDLIETEAINEVFRSSHTPDCPLILGAAKTCVGHTEIAAGLIGVLKTIGSFSHRSVPGLTHLTAHNLNSSIDCRLVPLQIPYGTAPLLVRDEPLRALVLANGFAGSIAGTILEEPKSLKEIDGTHIFSDKRPPMIFVVSARSQDALLQYLRDYLHFCKSSKLSDFESICYTSCIGREHYRFRFACVVDDMQDLIRCLEDQIESPTIATTATAPRRVLFGFPGQGSQYQGMARDLASCYSGFKELLTQMATEASVLTGHPILSLLLEKEAAVNIDQSEIAQICIFVYQITMSRWLESLGIHAQAVMGHSLGEIAATVIAGGMSFDVGLKFVAKRAELLRADSSRPAGMAAVNAPVDVVIEYIDNLDLGDRLVVAVYNGEKSHVVSGALDAVEMLVSAVKAKGIRATKLVVDQGFHSPCITSVLPALKAWLKEYDNIFTPLRVPVYSTAFGKEVSKGQVMNSQYWTLHAKNPVKFYQAALEIINKNFVDIILDVGPQPTIWSNLQDAVFSEKSIVSVVAKRGKNQEFAFLKALSQLFENGLTPNFSALYKQMPHEFTKMVIPTYPFQRRYHYPTYIASRTLAPVPGGAEKTRQSEKIAHPFPVDRALCDMLDEHRIEGRPVLPGSASLDFFARSCTSRSVQIIRFHQPLVIETPDDQVSGESDGAGAFVLYQGGTSGKKICSGIFGRAQNYETKDVACSGPPSRVLSHDEVYVCFKNVAFGRAFRNIEEIKIWPDHADAYITIEASKYPDQDRIRQLDSCLHMFGAIVPVEAPQLADLEGAFLPSALEGFSLHSDAIPYSYICRYHLPLEISRNSRVISVAFEVFAHTGELLVSCKKFSVAWVPSGVVTQGDVRPPAVKPRPNIRYLNVWEMDDLPKISKVHKFDELLYLGFGSHPSLLDSLRNTAQRTVFVELPEGEKNQECVVRNQQDAPAHLGPQMDGLSELIKGSDLSIVLDVSSFDSVPGSKAFTSLCHRILMFMKFVMGRRLQISSFVVISSMSAPVCVREHMKDSGILMHSKSLSAGAVIQGMLRVFRRETNLNNAVWGLDLPVLDAIPEAALKELVTEEIQARFHGSFKDTIVAYRSKAPGQPAVRLVPRMLAAEETHQIKISGTTVVIGMGSIGIALATALMAASSTHAVVFFSRKSSESPQIEDQLSRLQIELKGRCSYVQVDICNKAQLLAALSVVNSTYEPIEHIIHTAARINDTAIENVTYAAFEDVIAPKVVGAWNLHTVCEELKLPLKSFVMLSSIQVLLGNQGQVAYVAGNAFMDSLAAHRHSLGLPGTSLQLGVWESKLLNAIDLDKGFVFLIHHKEGIPAILQAMGDSVPVQILADWDVPKLSSMPAYAKDPFFASVIPAESTMRSKPKAQKGDVSQIVINILRSVLELRPNEHLELAESLTSCGIDSISFAQIRGGILKELEVDIPLMLLSDTYSINDMIENVEANF